LLVSNDSMINFMRKQDTSPLRVIVNRYIQTQTMVEEKIKIVEFLTSYAQIDKEGAEHLWSENIIKNLGISSLVTLINQIDFYSV
jgi:hypothetical protein